MKTKRKKVFAERKLFSNQQPANQSTAELQLKVEPKAEKGSQGAEPCPSICFRMLMIVAFPLSLVVFGLGFLLLIPVAMTVGMLGGPIGLLVVIMHSDRSRLRRRQRVLAASAAILLYPLCMVAGGFIATFYGEQYYLESTLEVFVKQPCKVICQSK